MKISAVTVRGCTLCWCCPHGGGTLSRVPEVCCTRPRLLKVVEGECTGFKGRHLQYRTDKGKCHALHDVDAIVCAIGYAPFLPRLQGLMSPAPQESEWHLGMWSPTVPKCAFVGFGFGFVSIPFLVDLQSQYLLRCVRDPALLSEMASLPTGQNFTDNRYIRSLLPPTTEAGATPAKAAPVAPLKIDPVQAPKQAADPATPASPVSGASGSALASPLSPTGVRGQCALESSAHLARLRIVGTARAHAPVCRFVHLWVCRCVYGYPTAVHLDVSVDRHRARGDVLPVHLS